MSIGDLDATATHLGHPEIPKLVPQILDSVQPDKRGSSKEPNPLDTTQTDRHY
jgi:hypothetical protein